MNKEFKTSPIAPLPLQYGSLGFWNYSRHNNRRKCAFTLAETLITLVIIGIVAAITVPVVMNNINSKQKEEKIRNVYQKLSKSTDKMLGISGMNGYSSTEEFLNAFKNHLSISKICKPENIKDCWGSKKITLKDGTKYDISNIKLPRDLKISKKTNPGFQDVMGFVMNDGTPFIVSYDTTCDMSLSDGRVWSGEKSSSTNCLSGIFDYNGGRKPNKQSDDILNFNLSAGIGSNCSFEVNGNCYTAPLVVNQAMSDSECANRKSELNLPYCNYEYSSSPNKPADYYAQAAAICGGHDNIISLADLQKIASEIYPNVTIKTNTRGTDSCENGSSCFDINAAAKYGISPGSKLFAKEYCQMVRPWYRNFSDTGTYITDAGHYSTGMSVVCKAE